MNDNRLKLRDALFQVLHRASTTMVIAFLVAIEIVFGLILIRYGTPLPILFDLVTIAATILFAIFRPILTLIFEPVALRMRCWLDSRPKASTTNEKDLKMRIATVTLGIISLILLVLIIVTIVANLRVSILDPEPDYLYPLMVVIWWAAKIGLVTSLIFVSNLGLLADEQEST